MENPLDLKLLMNQTTNVITPVAAAATTKTYKCDTCNAAYSDKMYFELHKQSHQKDMPVVQIVMNPSAGHQVVPQPAPAHQGATQILIQDDQLAAYKRAYGVEPQQVYTLAPVSQYQIITNNRSGTVSVPQSLQNQVNIPTYSTPTYVVATADGHQFHAISEQVIQNEQQQHPQEQQHQQETQQQHQNEHQQHQVQNQHQQQHQQHITPQQQESHQQEAEDTLTHQIELPQVQLNSVRANRGIIICQKDRPFKCDQCTASFIESAELDDHKKKHTGDGPFTCEDCHFTFMYKSHFKSHRTRCMKRRAMMPSHPKPVMSISPVKRQFPINHVQSVVSKHNQNSQHQQPTLQHHNFQQVHNSQVITKVSGPTNHKVNTLTRQGGKQSLPSKFNPSNPSFKRIKKESRFDRPYECDECDASFQNDVDLKNHKSKHTGDGPFKCEECRFVFLYRKLYDAHRRRCEKKRKELPYPPIIISNTESLSANVSQHSAGDIILTPQSSQVQHIQHQLQHETQVEGGQTITSSVPASSLPSTLLSGALQMHNINGQPTIIEMRTNSNGQDLQQIQIPHHSIIEQVVMAPGSAMANMGSGRHDIKYEVVPMQAGMVDVPEGVNLNQIVNLIKIKAPNQ